MRLQPLLLAGLLAVSLSAAAAPPSIPGKSSAGRLAWTLVDGSNLAGMKELLAGGFDVNTRIVTDVGMGVNESTLLVLAAELGKADVAALLLERGADVDAVMKGPINDGLTPLLAVVRHYHFHRQDSQAICRLLLDRHADPNASWHGDTSLWLAARFWGEALMPMLLEAGADPNIPDRDGQVLLRRYVGSARVPVVRALLEHGAVVDQATLDLAREERAKLDLGARYAANGYNPRGEDFAAEIADMDAILALLTKR